MIGSIQFKLGSDLPFESVCEFLRLGVEGKHVA